MCRIGFFPCHGSDISEPLRLVTGLVDTMVFCDINPCHQHNWRRLNRSERETGLPQPIFLAEDVRDVLAEIQRIDLFSIAVIVLAREGAESTFLGNATSQSY